MCYVCVHVRNRWRLHPSSLHFMERVTQRDRTPPRENQMARSAHWYRDQVNGNEQLSEDNAMCFVYLYLDI